MGKPLILITQGGGGGAGTVTSLSSGNLSPLFTTSVATPTTTPALTFALNTQNKNLFFASSSTADGNTPTFRAITQADLGATTIGYNLLQLTNPTAVTFPRFNADNSVDALTAANFRTAIGAGTGNGTVTSVAWTTSQGVSASIATSTTTPNITVTLGALTGVTSFNGLVVTANTGTITTGVWNGTAITVANGGTGLTTLTTAYGVVCAGTTATGNLQNAGAGLAGQSSISNGASALPSWQDNNTVLGSTYYDPAGAATYTTTSTTFAAVDTTNLRVTFTAPHSGNVIVKWGGWLNGTQPMMGVLEASTVRGVALMASINSFGNSSKKITGLTAGTSYTYDLAFASTTGGLTTTFKAGGGLTSSGFGACYIEVISA